MTYIMVDVEADGPIPSDFSMLSFGAVAVEPDLKKRFYREIRPISDRYVQEALDVNGFSREQSLTFGDPKAAMEDFAVWLKQFKKPIFIADNNGFDWQFICWYFHHFTGKNPFGHSSTNLSSLYKGMMKDAKASFRHLRQTKHTHMAIDDCIGNCEALISMKKMGMKFSYD